MTPDAKPKFTIDSIRTTINNKRPIVFDHSLFVCTHFSSVYFDDKIAFSEVLYNRKHPKKINIILLLIIISLFKISNSKIGVLELLKALKFYKVSILPSNSD